MELGKLTSFFVKDREVTNKKTLVLRAFQILIGDQYGIRTRECCRERAVC